MNWPCHIWQLALWTTANMPLNSIFCWVDGDRWKSSWFYIFLDILYLFFFFISPSCIWTEKVNIWDSFVSHIFFLLISDFFCDFIDILLFMNGFYLLYFLYFYWSRFFFALSLDWKLIFGDFTWKRQKLFKVKLSPLPKISYLC